MTEVPSPDEQSLSRLKRPARFSIASLALPTLGALLCGVCVPGAERRAGEMLSTGMLVCLFSLVGGAFLGVILAVVAMVRRESPRALWVAALFLNVAIVIYAYF